MQAALDNDQRQQEQKLQRNETLSLLANTLADLKGQSPELLPSPEALDALQKTQDRKSTRLNSSHVRISYAVFCLKKKKKDNKTKSVCSPGSRSLRIRNSSAIHDSYFERWSLLPSHICKCSSTISLSVHITD